MTSRPKPPRAAPDARPDALPDASWGTIIELCFSVRDWWGALCEELDLTPAQGMALRSLDRPLPMSTLADVLACDASNITGIVDKLESRGLIARRGADHDRRIKLLCMTERGRSLRDRLIRRLLEPPATLAALSHEAKTRLTATLRNLIGELSRTLDPATDDPGRRPLRAARG
jgi:MarR family transcriptional regulator, organic hydroperoxide resistance regulator